MSTTFFPPPPPPAPAGPANRPSPLRRFVAVVARPQSYLNLLYLLLGLPLGVAWFTILVTGASVGIAMIPVALVGIPLLLAMWYVSRGLANIERATVEALLDRDLPPVPFISRTRGNLWVRLRSLTTDRRRWREVAFLLLRFPVGIATFTVAVVALAVPGLMIYAPFDAHLGNPSYGEWALSSNVDDAMSSPWSWSLVPVGVVLLIAAFHLVNALADACGRWATRWLGR